MERDPKWKAWLENAKRTGNYEGGPYIGIRYSKKMDLTDRTPDGLKNLELWNRIKNSRGADLGAVGDLFAPGGNAAIQMYLGGGVTVSNPAGKGKPGGFDPNYSITENYHKHLDAWHNDPGNPGSWKRWNSCNSLRTRDPGAFSYGPDPDLKAYYTPGKDSIFNPKGCQPQGGGGASLHRAAALVRPVAQSAGSVVAALHLLAGPGPLRAADVGPAQVTQLGDVGKCRSSNAGGERPPDPEEGGGGGGGYLPPGGIEAPPIDLPPFLIDDGEEDDDPSPSPTPPPTDSPSVNPSGSPGNRESSSPNLSPSMNPSGSPGNRESSSPNPSPSMNPSGSPGNRESSSPNPTSSATATPDPSPEESEKTAETALTDLFNHYAADNRTRWSERPLADGAVASKAMADLARLAYERYKSELGECKGFVPAFMSTSFRFTREGLVAAVARGFAACGRSLPPGWQDDVKRWELSPPSENDPQLGRTAFEMAWESAGARMWQKCGSDGSGCNLGTELRNAAVNAMWSAVGMKGNSLTTLERQRVEMALERALEEARNGGDWSPDQLRDAMKKIMVDSGDTYLPQLTPQERQGIVDDLTRTLGLDTSGKTCVPVFFVNPCG
jgi:hypothetical protein